MGKGNNVEEAAWQGATRKERQALQPVALTDGIQLVKITGHIPDMQRFCKGVVSVVGGITGMAAAVFGSMPEMAKLSGAAVCTGDCHFTFLALTALTLLFGVGGAAVFVCGLCETHSGAGFDENTLTVKMQKV